jgi:DNA-binding PadR family transcriptional regulator
MAGENNIGGLEQLVLISLVRLGEDAYGVAVHEDITKRTGRSMTYATIYTTLSRLEQKGLVRMRTGEPTAERGGRRKNYYLINAAGRRALNESLDALRTMTRGLGAQLEQP